MLKFILWGVIFSVSGAGADAQRQDYIVTVKGDTIYGNMLTSSGVASKLETEQSAIPIDTSLIDAYYLASGQALYRRKTLPGKRILTFLRCREIGGINLYEDFLRSTSIDGFNIKTIITLFAEKETGQLLEVWSNSGLSEYGNKSQREVMALLLADDPRLRQIFDADSKYEAGDVDYYIREYNKDSVNPIKGKS